MSRVNLGDIVKDEITGFAGIVTGHARYITGCDQYLIQLIQPKVKDGAYVESRWCDDNRLVVVETKAVEIKGACGLAPIK